ncbi:MAG: 1-deoxy-D-xylulose-5-phosphate reductoisomerase, partial [Oscillospiraceae bacterium]
VKALSAHHNAALLAEQALAIGAQAVCIGVKAGEQTLDRALEGTGIRILSGMDGLCEIARMEGVDCMLNAVVGMVGLQPTLEAIAAGTDIALANKETLVAGGELVMRAALEKGVAIYPVDSEHSAIFQCLQGNARGELNKIILTASGGPFRGKTKAELENVTLADALKHPNWAMGRKITVDSATLMNKGLEFIEAVRLFDVAPEQIEVVVHRESVVHSAVEYKDYSVIAQLGVPDMKIPIQYALLYPHRCDCPTRQLSLTDYGTLHFEKPDFKTFGCLRACIAAVKAGGSLPAMVNGANEEAVAAFLNGEIQFHHIGEIVAAVTEEFLPNEISSLADVLSADAAARAFAKERIRLAH